jgi:hypothetical protein
LRIKFVVSGNKIFETNNRVLGVTGVRTSEAAPKYRGPVLAGGISAPSPLRRRSYRTQKEARAAYFRASHRVGPTHLPPPVDVVPRMHLSASGVLIVVASGCGKWVLQHPTYFCNMQIKHLQQTSETAKTFATHLKHLQKHKRNFKTLV